MERTDDQAETAGIPEAWVTLEGIADHLVVSPDTVRLWRMIAAAMRMNG